MIFYKERYKKNKKIYKAHNYICEMCRKDFKREDWYMTGHIRPGDFNYLEWTTDNYLTVHHIKPRKDGGKDFMYNLMCLCRKCHDFIEGKGLSRNQIKNYIKEKKIDKEINLFPRFSKEELQLEQVVNETNQKKIYPQDYEDETVRMLGEIIKRTKQGHFWLLNKTELDLVVCRERGFCSIKATHFHRAEINVERILSIKYYIVKPFILVLYNSKENYDITNPISYYIPFIDLEMKRFITNVVMPQFKSLC